MSQQTWDLQVERFTRNTIQTAVFKDLNERQFDDRMFLEIERWGHENVVFTVLQ